MPLSYGLPSKTLYRTHFPSPLSSTYRSIKGHPVMPEPFREPLPLSHIPQELLDQYPNLDKVYECQRCGHKWQTKQQFMSDPDYLPERCPKCKRWDWAALEPSPLIRSRNNKLNAASVNSHSNSRLNSLEPAPIPALLLPVLMRILRSYMTQEHVLEVIGELTVEYANVLRNQQS